MPRQADDYRDRAEDARARSKTAHSHDEGRLQLKRQKALNDLADIEDWLDGEGRKRFQPPARDLTIDTTSDPTVSWI
ncbi:hypothetical protein [Pseudorhodoplanes sinuspersici]|uniref:hypothetical protein n=1 Tax=Pseudorhodoplanes sinuspersici TaxID=1235591 RepID=UPI0011C35C2E|nr:hypothetical protein [Pseudorhodoplanes sinuspersici]